MAYDDRELDQALALKLWVVLARAHGAVSEHVKADIASHDLTAGEFAVLEVLLHKGPLTLGEVQRKILVSSGGITYLVDRLEKAGLVERRPCPTDRRAYYAALTPAGEERIRQIFPEHARCIEAVLSGLDREEKEQAIALLRKLGRVAAEMPACGAGKK
jgi:MarR family 2-MHQ and catechol resistance regulon transcriptional repressor